MLNLSMLLEDAARNYPSKAAYIFGNTQLTFKQTNDLANQVANGLLSKGLKPDDKVALSCINSPWFPVVYFGILKAGCVVVPIGVLLKKDEIAYHLNDSDAKAYFCHSGTTQLPIAKEGWAAFGLADNCEHFFEITPYFAEAPVTRGAIALGELIKNQSPVTTTFHTAPNDTAVIIYTSGTTGKPKGAQLSHHNLLMNTIICSDLFCVMDTDVFITVLPMFHIFAMTVKMNLGLYRGVTNVLMPRFEVAEIIHAIQQYQVTIFAGVPTMYWAILNYQGDNFTVYNQLHSLRMCISGGASLPVQVLHDFEKKFKVPILEGYGMSEGSPVVTFNPLGKQRKPGSIGTPIWGVEVKLVDRSGNELGPGEKGELWYRGHNVMKGYYKRESITRDSLTDGWLHSGDIAMKDEEGYYYIVDRTGDMIIRGGFNVYPREVEEVLIKHPAVSLVAVIGVSDEQYGEEIKAFVVLKPGQEISKQELIEFTRDRLAAYKYPRIIEFTDSLPVNATGKIMKAVLRQQEVLSLMKSN